MKKIFNKLSLVLFAAVVFACSSEDDLVEDWIEVNEPAAPSTGSLDLSNYVAVGNSLTAGFTDGALHPDGQMESYPNILATQFLTAGGGAFVQPDITSGNGFGGVDGDNNALGRSFIDLAAAVAALEGTGSFGDVIQFSSGDFLSQSTNTGSSLNNFGVPGARVVDLTTAGYGIADFGNPFYNAFASDPSTSTILGDAVSADASFFTLWIGSNDVLGYATAGGDGAISAITSTADFQTAYGTVLASLTADGAQGIVLNVPPVTIIPFFQTVTTLNEGVSLIPLDQATADAVNAGYATYNGTLDLLASAAGGELITQAEADSRKINFVAGVNPPVILDESLTDLTAVDPALLSMRQAAIDPTTGSSDLFPLTALSVIGTLADPTNPNSVIGVGVPVEDRYVLTPLEQVEIITAYATYNVIIETIVDANPNVTMVDVRPLFADMYGLSAEQAAALQLGDDGVAAADGVLGLEVGGINLVPLSLSTTELYNSVWSTDGVHPNGRGAALIANEIIKAINETYGASIPEVNPLDYAPINAPF
ncbi:SGNH/GDSL hydrolase family protein [Ekhidna sp.]